MEFMYLWQVLKRAYELYHLWSEVSGSPSNVLSAIFNWGLESGEVSDEEFNSAMEFGLLNECWGQPINEIM